MNYIEHGGNLRHAAAHYCRPVSDWIDCSTCIQPDAFPVPLVPQEIWQRLPEQDDGLESAAQRYFESRQVLAVPGTQWAIQQLPDMCIGDARVGIISPTYGEYVYRWQCAGHRVMELPETSVDENIDKLDVLVVVNPNNPTGARIERERLLTWHRRLAARRGWLIVDEAFADAEPDESLCGFANQEGLIVLRSVGKFFGLAGVRLGFVLTSESIGDSLRRELGPWAVSNPARWAGRLALSDTAWQMRMRVHLMEQIERLVLTLKHNGLSSNGGTRLFRWCMTDSPRRWQQALAQQGIWVRAFDHPRGLRFGLPHSSQWSQFESRLAAARHSLKESI